MSRGSGSEHSVRTTVWFWPLVGLALSCLVTLGLLQVRPDPRSRLAQWVWPTDG